MEFKNNVGFKIYLVIAKAPLVFFLGGIVIHVIVMVIDYFLMIEPFYLDVRENFIPGIFSEPMMPMMATYGLLSLGIFFLWEKAKNAALKVREKEWHQEKAEAVLKSLQRFTGILAEQIASQNSEIVNWIELRKRSGHPVPARVEKPSKQISKAIQSMSELAFILPYTDNQPLTTCEFEKFFFDKLSEPADVTSEKQIALDHQTVFKN